MMTRPAGLDGVAPPLLRASVGPLAAAVIARELGPLLERMAVRWAAVGPGGEQVAVQLREALGEMREAARLRHLAQGGRRGVCGTTEVPQTVGVAGSGHLLGTDWLSVGEVATRSGRSERTVRTWCEDEVLVATRLSCRGRPYRIDPVSVEVFLDERRRT